MQVLPRLLLHVAALGFGIGAAGEDANLKCFRDVAGTRSHSLGRPVAPKLTPDGQPVDRGR